MEMEGLAHSKGVPYERKKYTKFPIHSDPPTEATTSDDVDVRYHRHARDSVP